MLSLLVAFDENYGIGYDGWMPWHLPEDLKQFKQRTLNHKIVMGKSTFLAIGKALPNRTTYVVTHDNKFHDKFPTVEVIHDLMLFLRVHEHDAEEIFICGGASIYAQALPYCSQLIISEVKGVFPADTHFPMIESARYEEIEHQVFEGFTLKVLKRKATYAESI